MATTDTEKNRQYCNAYRSSLAVRDKFNAYQRDKQREYRAARIAARAASGAAVGAAVGAAAPRVTAKDRGDRSHERAKRFPVTGPKFYCRAFPAVCPQQRDGQYCTHEKRVCPRQCLVYNRKGGKVCTHTKK